MSDKDAEAEPQPLPQEGELIDGLTEDPNYFALKYNERQQTARDLELQAAVAAQASTNKQPAQSSLGSPAGPRLAALDLLSSRAGGVYVPPHKLRKLQEELMRDAETNEEQRQRIKWEMLRKSINEIVNKVP